MRVLTKLRKANKFSFVKRFSEFIIISNIGINWFKPPKALKSSKMLLNK